MIENAKSLGMAYEKIKKEAVTDAIKRAMRQFGNALGNCVYDKEYIRTVKHVQKQPRNRLQGEDLFRYSDMVDVASCANLQFGRGGDTDCASTGAAGDQPNTVAQDLKGVTDDRGEESDDFDMIDFGDDAFEEFNGMESDRPVIPESPSGSFNNRQAQHGNQPAQNTPTRVATGGPVWRPSSEPGPMPSRMQGASPGGQVSMASARNLSFQSHPPRPAMPAQQASSTTTSVRRPSFAEASGFTPSPQMAAVLGTRSQSADNST
ncbi:DNA repair protein rad52, partial [Coemansia sp. 'formosensis']